MTTVLEETIMGALAGRLGQVQATQLEHPRQFNRTWKVTWASGEGILKSFVGRTASCVAAIVEIENRVRSAAVPVPRTLMHLLAHASILYEIAPGTHEIARGPQMAAAAAKAFRAQAQALSSIHVPWLPPRPTRLPRRAQIAVSTARGSDVAATVLECWAALAGRATITPTQVSHADWRADNLLWRGHRLTGVVDWDGLFRVPCDEAVGHAAASLTHSWRPALAEPVESATILEFLTEFGDGDVEHQKTAALYGASVRVLEEGDLSRERFCLLREALA